MKSRVLTCLLSAVVVAGSALAQPEPPPPLPTAEESFELAAAQDQEMAADDGAADTATSTDESPGPPEMADQPAPEETGPEMAAPETTTTEETTEEPESETEKKSESPEEIAAPEGETVEEGLMGGESLWPDYYGPPYAPTFDPHVMFKGGCIPTTLHWPHTWGQFDALLWWTKGSHLPPLATTGLTSTPLDTVGALGTSGTQILFGQQSVNNTARGGGRMNLGVWLDQDCTVGIGGSFLALQGLTAHFDRTSTGDPVLARPIFDTALPGETAEVVAYPNFVKGTITDSASSKFLAADAYLRETVRRGPRGRLDMLYGYRFAGLDEGLVLNDLTTAITSSNPQIPINTSVLGRESFLARSQFHGAMIGFWYQSQVRNWGLDVMGKLSLGDVHQIMYITGGTLVSVPGSPTVFNGGSLLAQPSNIGRFVRNQFGVLPEIQLNLTHQFDRHWKFRVGYTMMYLNNVIQVGRQVDTTINSTQIGGNPLVGALRPIMQFHGNEYWAQGLNVGAEFSY